MSVSNVQDKAWTARAPVVWGHAPRTRRVLTEADLELAEISQVPQVTTKGVIWMHPISPPIVRYWAAKNVCASCSMEAKRKEAVRNGNFIACERALKKEILE